MNKRNKNEITLSKIVKAGDSVDSRQYIDAAADSFRIMNSR